MQELSLINWIIHISSVLEWVSVIFIIYKLSLIKSYGQFYWLAFAMIPNLIGAMCAITWHIFDNPPELYGLVTLQGIFTLLGNFTLAIATILIFKRSSRYE